MTTTTINDDEIEITLHSSPDKIRFVYDPTVGMWGLHLYPADVYLDRRDLEGLQNVLNWIRAEVLYDRDMARPLPKKLLEKTPVRKP